MLRKMLAIVFSASIVISVAGCDNDPQSGADKNAVEEAKKEVQTGPGAKTVEDTLKEGLKGKVFGDYGMGSTDWIELKENPVKSFEIIATEQTERGFEYLIEAQLQGGTGPNVCVEGSENTCPAKMLIAYRQIGDQWVLENMKLLNSFSYPKHK